MNPALRTVMQMMCPMDPRMAEAMLTYGSMIRRKGQDQVAMMLGVHDGSARTWAMMLMTPDEPHVMVWLPVDVADRWEAL
jgi:hypothetical protein